MKQFIRVLYSLIFKALCFVTSTAFAQTGSEGSPISCDCLSAIPLSVRELLIYGPTQAPPGFGSLQEIKATVNNSKTAFEKEHHSAWYLLSIQQDGELVLTITGMDSSNDYDFLIYPYTDSNTCRSIIKNKVQALRGNLSRNSAVTASTGLSAEALYDFHEEGPGEQYSKSLPVKKGEQYLLVLDNVSEKAAGHRLSINILRELSISGIITNEAGKPVAAEVSLMDIRGEEISKTNSNTAGEYSLKSKVIPNANYSLTFTNDSSFLATESINTRFLNPQRPDFNGLKTVLPQLRKGKKYQMGDIHFEGNSARIVPASHTSLVSLYHLMQRNKKLRIRIEGHVNGTGELPPDLVQQLSEDRAETVYRYLLRKGIDASRLSKIGLGKSQMIFAIPKTIEQHEANRRVEINVLDF